MSLVSPFRLPRKTPFALGENVAEWATGLSKLDKFYAKRPVGIDTQGFLRFTLEVLGIDYRIARGSLNNVPETGATIIVANHPLGCVEGIILAELLLMLRSDVKILANHYLKTVPELDQLFIGVDVFEGKQAHKANHLALREAHRHLQQQGLLLLFPAGEVSTMVDSKQGRLEDKQWSRSVASLIQSNHATTVPVFIDGHNSKRFYLAGKVHPLLRTLMLGRELLNKHNQCIDISIGSEIKPRELNQLSEHALVGYLRLNTYLLHQDNTTKTAIRSTQPESPIAKRLPLDTLLEDLANLPFHHKLFTHQDFEVYCTKASMIPAMLHEIGRVRETNFRDAGEGTGHGLDLDVFDQHYHHLFIWDRKEQQLVGAYRLGLVDKILTHQDINGLYSHTLFDYNYSFLNKMGNAIELGRSVIAKPYQKSTTALLLLWKGIAHFIYQNPHYTHLFGPVSISNDYSDQARQLLVQTLTQHYSHSEFQDAVTARTPFSERQTWCPDMLAALNDVQRLSKVLSRIDEGRTVPVLLRHYLGLNGKIVSFNLDAQFNHALDGLIMVDLTQVPEKTLQRYMGEEAACRYLTIHNQV
ncbi:lysophospholipid acyltransferase family protein [Vibrio sp. AK197]